MDEEVPIDRNPQVQDRQLPLEVEPPLEDFLAIEPRRYSPLDDQPSSTDAVPAFVFMALCACVSLMYWGTPYRTLLPVSGESIFERLELWRLLSALFTHADIIHLLSNTPLLLIFGWLLRAYFGLRIFPVLCIVLGVATNLLTVWFYPPQTRLVGASGMVFGMVGLWLTLYIRYDHTRKVRQRLVRATGFAMFMLIPSTFDPTTSYLAHGLGFGLGIIFAGILIALNLHRLPPNR